MQFVGMAGLDDKDAMEDFVRRHGLDGFPHAIDRDGSIWTPFGVTTQSSFVFADDDGTLETTIHRVLGEAELRDRINALIDS